MSDPLSQTTRKTRVSFLVFGSASLIVELYRVQPTNLPILGPDYPVPASLLPFALGLGSVYLFLSFTIYALDDLSRLETKGSLQRKIHAVHRAIEETEAKLSSLVNELADVSETFVDGYGHTRYRQGSGVDLVSMTEAKIGIEKSKLEQLILEDQRLSGAVPGSSASVLRSFRFWIFELGVPIVLAALIVVGWFDKLYWLREFVI